uniref:Uncharacterized protein n=1 Tax=Lepeophtheirus salmonis TaxID=72036 RepID=A0A0K2TXG3_LEPSM
MVDKVSYEVNIYTSLNIINLEKLQIWE